MDDYLLQLSAWIRPHLGLIAFSYMASLLAIFGNRISRGIQSMLAGAHFLLRTLVFILICALGLGLMLRYGSHYLLLGLSKIPNLWLGLTVVISFLVIGWLAEKYSR